MVLGVLIFLIAQTSFANWSLTQAVDLLRQKSPHGYFLYQLRNNPAFFERHLTLEHLAYSVLYATHENVHFLYHGGVFLGQPHPYFLPSRVWIEVKNKDLFWRSELVEEVDADKRRYDVFDEHYLRGQSKTEDIVWVLEELNAYTHDVMVAIDLASLLSRDEQINERDGLASAMFYLKLYLYRAKTKHPGAWIAIARDPGYEQAIKLMWRAADDTFRRACLTLRLGSEEKSESEAAYSADRMTALAELLGYVPAMPTECASVH